MRITMKNLKLILLLALSAISLHAQTAQFITVDKNVNLEVLDWGGTGRPLIFLAGAGDTAHRFDNFAPRFVAQHHVYGITRRGFAG
jgi:pimeloyl-ACP methyl ester carboxylesterase